MLYLDSSALVKRYLLEPGTNELNKKVQEAVNAGDPILTSYLSYAEIHAAFARKLKEWQGPAAGSQKTSHAASSLPRGTLRPAEYHWAVTQFDSDWRTYLSLVELSQRVLDLVPDLVKRHPLRAADAIQLASAVWIFDAVRRKGARKSSQGAMVFATCDKRLLDAAEHERLEVFNPEDP